MRTKIKILIIAILAIVLAVVLANVVGSSAVWDTDGWIISQTYTNPNPTAGTVVAELTGTVTFRLGDSPVGEPEVKSQTIELRAGVSTITRTWTSDSKLQPGYTISNVSGDGTAVFDSAGSLKIIVTAPNDGKEHSVQLKLQPVGGSILTRLPIFTAMKKLWRSQQRLQPTTWFRDF